MGTRIRLTIPALALWLAAPAFCQPASVSGTTFGANHQPLPGCTVILVPTGGGMAQREHPQTTSNTSGQFSFDATPPGAYSVIAMHDGYADYDSLIGGLESAWAADGPWKIPEPFTIAPGKSISNFDIELTPMTILSGKVLDEDGNPMPGVTVHGLTPRFVENGRLRPALAGEVSKSGANGEYSLAVSPGCRWFLMATPELPYAPSYYPDAAELSTAIAVDTTAPAISGLNFHLKKTDTFHVRGQVKGAPTAGLLVTVWRETGEGRPERFANTHTVRKDGTFDLSGLPGGNWTLDLRMEGKPNSHGRGSVQLRDADVENLTLHFMSQADVSGRVIGMPETKGIPTAMQVRLKPLEPALTAVGVRISPDGSFILKNVEAGHYRLDLVPPTGLWVKSAMLGGSDLLSRGLDLSAGGASGLEILIGGPVGQITGTVTTPDGIAASTSVITLSPDGPPAPVYRPELYLSTLSTASGQFVFRNVVPGRYRVQAWERLPLLPSPLSDRLIFPDPAFPPRFESQSVTVTVGEGEMKSATVPLIPRQAMLEEARKRQ